MSAAVHTARCWIQHPTARRPSAAHSSQIISVALWQRCAAGEPAGKGCSEPCEGTKEVKPAGRVHRRFTREEMEYCRGLLYTLGQQVYRQDSHVKSMLA